MSTQTDVQTAVPQQAAASRSADDDPTLRALEKFGPLAAGETKISIVYNALEIFAVEGYAGTSMRDIARQTGITAASIYAHYDSKEALLWEIGRIALDVLDSLLVDADEEATPREQLIRFIRAHLFFHVEYGTMARIGNGHLKSLDAGHYREAKRRRDDYVTRLEGLILAAVEAGEVELSWDVKVLTLAILELGKSIAGWYDPRGGWSPEKIIDDYERLILTWLGTTPDR